MILQSIKGMMLLIRFVPVLSWSLCAILLSIGFAVHDLKGFMFLSWTSVTVLLIGALLLQGLVSHAFNDRMDWKSGTDQHSTGILSGGSKVIPKHLFSERQLLQIGLLAILIAIELGIYLSHQTSNLIWLFILTGIWSALTYSVAPIRFSYYPFLGEWASAFPAMVACSLGTYYVLTGFITTIVIWASVIHSLLCVAWLMQHHLSDIDADLSATPRKMTTVAYLTVHLGKETTPRITVTYFFLAAFISLLATFFVHRIFIFSLFCSLMGSMAAWKTNPHSIESITSNQIKMIVITVLHTLILFGIEVLSY